MYIPLMESAGMPGRVAAEPPDFALPKLNARKVTLQNRQPSRVQTPGLFLGRFRSPGGGAVAE